MSDPDYTLNITHSSGGEVHLHVDLQGLDVLMNSLNYIKKNLIQDKCEHDHLFTEDWGGSELTNKNLIMNEGHEMVHHLKIYGWNKEWSAKHGFKSENA